MWVDPAVVHHRLHLTLGVGTGDLFQERQELFVARAPIAGCSVRSMRSYVINLPLASDRLEAFREREAGTGLASEVFPAVDGRTLAELPPHRADLSHGEVGCLLSHRELLRHIAAESDLGWIVVLEDDVHFWSNFPELLERTVADADRMGRSAVQLGWVPLTKKPNRILLAKEQLVARPQLRRALRLVKPGLKEKAPWVVGAPWGYGTHCYMVRADFAVVVADFLSGPRIHAPVDHTLPLLRSLYPELVGRARFSLAGQVPDVASTVVDGRERRPFQTDSTGRVVR